MRESCNLCDFEVSPRKTLTCQICASAVHYACAGMTKDNFGKQGSMKAFWKCSECKTRKLKSGSEKNREPRRSSNLRGRQFSDGDGETEAESEASDHERTKKKEGTDSKLDSILTGLSKFSGKMNDFEKFLSFNSDKLDDVLLRFTQFTGFEKSLKKLAEAYQVLEAENSMMKREIINLNQRLNDVERNSFATDAEICGVPETKNEDLSALLVSTGKAVGVTLTKENIVHATRVKPRTVAGTPQPQVANDIILVRFDTEGTKNKIITAARENRESINLSIHQDFPADKTFYVNDRLTPYSLFLRWLARQHAKEYGFKFVWTKNGKVYIRKDENARAQLVSLDVLRSIDKKSKFKDLSFMKFSKQD